MISRVFIAYRHTDADKRDLHEILTFVKNEFLSLQIDVRCTFFGVPGAPAREFSELEYLLLAFSEIDHCDTLFVVQTSTDKSEGMLIEVGYSWHAQITIVAATHSAVEKTYLPKLSPLSFRWTTLKELSEGIKATVLQLQAETA